MRQVIRCRTRVVVSTAARQHTDGLGRKRGEGGFHVFRTQSGRRSSVVGSVKAKPSRPESTPRVATRVRCVECSYLPFSAITAPEGGGDEPGLTAKDGPDQLNGRGQDLAPPRLYAWPLPHLRSCASGLAFSLDVLRMFCAVRLASFFLAQHSLFFVLTSATLSYSFCLIILLSLIIRHLSHSSTHKYISAPSISAPGLSNTKLIDLQSLDIHQ